MATTEEGLVPVFRRESLTVLTEDVPPNIEKDHFPMPEWTFAHRTKNGRKLPQAIGHRGYKAKFPENSMVSMQGAIAAGAHALETDIYYTQDDVVVLSHDPTLKRCFGREEKINECTWEFLSTLRTIGDNPQPMARLTELLELLALPENAHLWLCLDIKMYNKDHDRVMRLIADAISEVKPIVGRSWEERVVLGIWATKFIPLCHKHLPDFPICHISFSTTYAHRFFRVPNTGFSITNLALLGPLGTMFLKRCKRYQRPVLTWTVNEEKRMRWCVRHELDGVITDDPVKFLEICKAFEEGRLDLKKSEMLGVKEWLRLFLFEILLTAVLIVMLGWKVEKQFIRKVPKVSKAT